jgi:hypothetical protein
VEWDGGAKGPYAVALARERRPLVLTNTEAAQWAAMGLWTPHHFCRNANHPATSVPVFKHTYVPSSITRLTRACIFTPACGLQG